MHSNISLFSWTLRFEGRQIWNIIQKQSPFIFVQKTTILRSRGFGDMRQNCDIFSYFRGHLARNRETAIPELFKA